jgi:hypothetical protein
VSEKKLYLGAVVGKNEEGHEEVVHFTTEPFFAQTDKEARNILLAGAVKKNPEMGIEGVTILILPFAQVA